MEQESREQVAQQYRDEGYDVVVEPRGDRVPPFLAEFRPNLIATRGKEGVVVQIKTNRLELSGDDQLILLADRINAQPGWRLDVVVLEQESSLDRMMHDSAEPSEEQLAQILIAADELADKGYVPYACVVAWGGLEASMRRLRDDAELYGRKTPTELMRTLYSNGFLSREQFERLRESYKIRSQVVHGLVPTHVDPELVRYVTATARYLVNGGAAVSSSRAE